MGAAAAASPGPRSATRVRWRQVCSSWQLVGLGMRTTAEGKAAWADKVLQLLIAPEKFGAKQDDGGRIRRERCQSAARTAILALGWSRAVPGLLLACVWGRFWCWAVVAPSGCWRLPCCLSASWLRAPFSNSQGGNPRTPEVLRGTAPCARCAKQPGAGTQEP